VDSLPNSLREEAKVVWDVPLGQAGLGGLAAADGYVFFGDRDLDNLQDVFRCLDASNGEPVWEVTQVAIGMLDYGNSPRATPLIHGDHVVFFGAMGDLICVERKTGKTEWHLNVRDAFNPTEELPWGYCGSPLLVDGKIIINPGAADASLVAIDANDGKVIWKSPGLAAAYGSFIVNSFGGQRQIVGHDSKTLGGWDSLTGQRLWTISPPYGGEFNVPTPVTWNDQLIVSAEQNGTRAYRFDKTGRPDQKPISQNVKLTPDMSSAVVVGHRLYCVNSLLYCLDLEDGLKELWRIRDPALSEYASLIASEDRLLVTGDGELLLLKTDGDSKVFSRQRVFDTNDRILSHPALVGNRLYIRGETRLRCIELE
jgi:outer membrane protein assembly factor BamB